MGLTNSWQAVSKRWGHAFHAMCSDMAMFPPRLPHYFIQKFTRPGDVVLDPFCGRGTTALQACVTGRVGIGVDCNPLAYVLTRAKIDPPRPEVVESRLRALENDMFYGDAEGVPEPIEMLVHRTTLKQLVYLKGMLDLDDPCDAFIAATILGLMPGAGSRDPTRSNPLAISIPNTFRLSPSRIRPYIDERRLKKIPVNVFTALRKKFKRLFVHELPVARGSAFCEPIENLTQIPNVHVRDRQVQLIVTSPPPPKVVKHGLHNGIRLWFLDVDPTGLDKAPSIDRRLDDYLVFIRRALARMYTTLRPGGVCCLVVGDVFERSRRGRVPLADEIRQMLQATRSRFRLCDIVKDRLPDRSTVSKIGREKIGRATRVDRILVLYRDFIEEVSDEVDWSPPKKRKTRRARARAAARSSAMA